EFANRVSNFDIQTIRDIKRFVNLATLRPDAELAGQMDAFWAAPNALHVCIDHVVIEV
ncbi:MAG: Enoyl-CoA hydratase/carnithine racemase, partial [Mycobacterium sp.]|nr:Enoyl-CoA hydratase/carnithine racemase [Mycobacterium sp.]